MAIEVICGPMFSGKTEELIRRIIRAKYANQNVLSIKPVRDNRYGDDEHIRSHSGGKQKCINIKCIYDIQEIINKSNKKYDLIVIEEAQFFSDDPFIKTLQLLRKDNYNVLIAGLDMDFLGKPFENITYAMGMATNIEKITAVCVSCSQDATMTYKKTHNNKRLEVGESDLYEARCYNCWNDKKINENKI